MSGCAHFLRRDCIRSIQDTNVTKCKQVASLLADLYMNSFVICYTDCMLDLAACLLRCRIFIHFKQSL